MLTMSRGRELQERREGFGQIPQMPTGGEAVGVGKDGQSHWRKSDVYGP